MKVMVLGATGMLGHVMVKVLAASPTLQVTAVVRSAAGPQPEGVRLCTHVDAMDLDALAAALETSRPDVVVNCIGVVKQRSDANDPLAVLPINALFPHRLARLCALAGARLIHFSTDCVFSGARGAYRESDTPDATDLYGRSKLLGEVSEQPHALTLRVSIIGPELRGAQGLLGWFLSQRGPVHGFRHAIFSGLTTLELSRVVRDRLVGLPKLHGLYHLSAEPISKLELLRLTARIYDHPVEIEPKDRPAIDRSLDSERLRKILGYRPPSWPEMLTQLREGMRDE
jgi:dTDP-4-dehydrorhamnose reductase